MLGLEMFATRVLDIKDRFQLAFKKLYCQGELGIAAGPDKIIYILVLFFIIIVIDDDAMCNTKSRKQIHESVGVVFPECV